MIGLLRIIFIFGIIYIIYRFLTRFLLPMFLGNFINRKMSEMRGDQNDSRRKTHREGEVIIDKVEDKKKHYSKNTGEYIDFEEIKK